MILPKPFDDKNHVYAVIETPGGSRLKYTYDQEQDYFSLTRVLPTGTHFPFDFGFIPYTIAEDGDPLDILVINDHPTFAGCIVETKVIGALLCEQKENGNSPYRNDRIIAVATESIIYSGIKGMEDLNEHYMIEIIQFFKYTSEMAGKQFEFLQRKNSDAAMQNIINHGIQN